MKTIVAGEGKICKLLGKQQIKTNSARYRCMKYLLRAECTEGILLHNVITGQLVLLDKIEADALNRLPIMSCNDITELIENYFLVPEEFDEKATVSKLRVLMNRLFTPKDISLFTILTTTNCNARCFYCYEKGLTRIDMDEATANQVIDYISANGNPYRIKLHWFGGEPLICSQRIDQICSGLRSRNVDYSSSMTSNGYLFDSYVVKRASELWRLEEVQITLDGRADTYNRVKAYVVNDNNPYARVLNNIELLLKSGVRVSIRLNFDQFNVCDVKALASELKGRFGQYKNVSVYPHFILQRVNVESALRSQLEEDELLIEQTNIEQQLIECGLRKMDMSLPRIRARSCGADKEDSIVVYPDGMLYKCIEISEFDQVGYIGSSHLNKTILKKYQDCHELEECAECPLYPYCILLKECHDTGKFNRINCENKLRRNIAIVKANAVQCGLYDNSG